MASTQQRYAVHADEAMLNAMYELDREGGIAAHCAARPPSRPNSNMPFGMASSAQLGGGHAYLHCLSYEDL